MPVGIQVAQAIALVGNGFPAADIANAGDHLLAALNLAPDPAFEFPHVRITNLAFPPHTERAIASARTFLANIPDERLRLLLDVACMSVLEDVSFTRKDGQYLRWDTRCGRPLRSGIDKGTLPDFGTALERKLSEIVQDAELLAMPDGQAPTIVQGSALHQLALLPDQSVGLVVTSPPYANRYDYTRTYALELAWLGYDQKAFSAMRQALLSATVENRPKHHDLDGGYPRQDILAKSREAVAKQYALAEVLAALNRHKTELSNPHVIRLIKNYFDEMALVVAELARIVAPSGKVVMVNDNVQYHGIEVPVDLILSDMAESLGFRCEEIGTLPRGKGNASQQMGKFGRKEIRKCVYRWSIPSV